MTDRDTFETRLAAMLERYADRGPTAVEPVSYARAITSDAGRAARARWRGGRAVWPLARAVLLVGAALLLAISATLVGARLLERQPPSGGTLAIARSGGLDFAEADGSSPRAVLEDGSTFNPAWSPSGLYLAVSQVTDAEPNLLRVLGADGVVMADVAGVSAFDWAPTAGRLAVLDVATNQIRVIAADGRLLATPLLPAGPLAVWSFDWSPDDRSIVVSLCQCEVRSSLPDGRTANTLWIADVEGGAPRRLLQPQEPPAIYPAWSPDGTRIAFTIPDCADGSCPGSIRIVDVETGVRRAEVENVNGGGVNAWSPSGAQLAFEAVLAGQSDIFIAKSDMTTVDRLTTDSAHDRQPSWSPDGAAVLFWHEIREHQGARGEIWAARPDGSGSILLADDSHGAGLQPAR
jgi:dipeptidyl aminopeptidase/acylaminoacyl peptidase